MAALQWSLLAIGSLVGLVWASGLFVRSAEAIGLRLGISPFILGVTVVAFGTSFPELVSAIFAVLAEAPEIAVGTAVGSNVTNILLILGISSVVGGGLQVDYELVRVDLPFLFGSALVVWLFAHDGSIDAFEGVIALAALAVYLVYAASTPEDPGTVVASTAAEVAPDALEELAPFPRRAGIELFGSALLLQLSAYLMIESVVRSSGALGVGTEIIAATAVALGTSLPELVVSFRSARAGKPEIAVGNVIGSNVFNALGVIGIASFFGELAVPASLLGFAIPAMVGVTILGFFVLQEREITVWDGCLLLVLYAGFTLQILRLE